MLLLIFELRFPPRLIFGSEKVSSESCKTKPTVVPLKIQASHDITKQKSTPAGMLSFGAVDGTLRSNRPLLALRAARSDCFRFPAGQNAPPDRFVPPASSPVRHNQTQRHPTGASVFGAVDGT